MRRSAPRAAVVQRGFTLIEMAVVVGIMALILGGILVPLTARVEQRRSAEAQRQMEEIKEALIGYALAQSPPHLPCPDRMGGAGAGTPNDGVEDVEATGVCVEAEGNLPWATLGLAATDPWGNRYRYRVTVEFAQRAPASTFGLATQGNLLVCPTIGACGAGQAITVLPPSANSPVAVIVSHGPNGFGAINAATNVSNPNPIGNDERENVGGLIGTTEGRFISRAPSPTNSALGEYDDIVLWLSPHILRHRMVAAGKLP